MCEIFIRLTEKNVYEGNLSFNIWMYNLHIINRQYELRWIFCMIRLMYDNIT